MPPPQLAVRNIPPHVNNIAHLNNHFARDQLYKNRSSRKIDSQKEKRSSGRHIALKIVLENRFSGKTYCYTIASRFGALINVQVQFEGDPASALVTFANPMEAEAAYSAPDAVLGNRFIKMFFHYDRNAKSVRDRLGGHGHLNQGIKTAGMNCIKLGLPRKLIVRDYFQANRTSRRPFLLLIQ